MTIRHDAKQRAFVADLPEGRAELTYAQPSPTVLDLNHTFVPEAARQRRVAAMLVREAMAYARANGMKVIPTCPYVAAFVMKNREYDELLDQA